MQTPILYSFRRCPYAIRARMAICYSGIRVELREVRLANKPSCMLNWSPKGTVPVLVIADDTVIDESIDIMRWALSVNDPDDWARIFNVPLSEQLNQLIYRNDFSFKANLDRYKYADRYPQKTANEYREKVINISFPQ